MVLIGASASNYSGRTQYFGECIFFLSAGQNINVMQQPVLPQLPLRVTASGSDSDNGARLGAAPGLKGSHPRKAPVVLQHRQCVQPHAWTTSVTATRLCGRPWPAAPLPPATFSLLTSPPLLSTPLDTAFALPLSGWVLLNRTLSLSFPLFIQLENGKNGHHLPGGAGVG